jgi:hypothetical protein
MNSRHFGDSEGGKGHAKQVSDADMYGLGAPRRSMLPAFVPFSAHPSLFKAKTTAFESERNYDFKNTSFMLNGVVCTC